MINWDTNAANSSPLVLRFLSTVPIELRHTQYCVEFAQDWCLDLSEFALIPAD